MQTLQRLSDVIVMENNVLKRHEIASHTDFADRKNQALRDLMIAQRGLNLHEISPSVKELAQTVSAELLENSRLLKLHISAVGEVSDIIIATMREAESDGTYARSKPPQT